jgi:HEAT repeat protein
MRTFRPASDRTGLRRRTVVLTLLAAAATCRPPDMSASGGCIPWTESSTGPSGPHVAVAGPDVGEAGEPAAAADVATEAAVSLAATLPPLRVRLALRPGAPIAEADAVGRDDVFFSQLAAALSARPLFEADPDLATLAENLSRAAGRRREDATLSATRSTGLEPFLVATVGLQRPTSGSAVTEPTYIVGLTLVVRRAAERDAFEAPPAVAWELDLPARAVRSERLVGTVAQAIEARVQVEMDREAAEGRDLLGDPLLAQRLAETAARLFVLGRVAYADLVGRLSSERSEERAAAARALARAGDPDLLDVYARMLGEADAEVRLAAIDGFWRAVQGRPPAVGDDEGTVPPPDVAWLVPSGDTVCRFGAGADGLEPPAADRARILGEHLERLRGVLTDPDPRVGDAALVLLTEAGDAEVRAAIRAALRAADSPESQDLLAVALGRLGDRSAAPRLRQIVNDARELEPAAAVTLGTLGDRSADDALREMLGSTDERVRCAAAEALAGTRSADATETLVPLLSNTQPPAVAKAAKATLVSIGEPAIPVLAAALDAADPSVSWAAAEALGEIGDKAAVAPLTAKLAGLDAVLRDYIVEALGRIGEVSALPAIVAAFGGTPEYRNEAPILRAVQAFGRRAVAALVDGLASDDPAIRAGAIEGLNRVGDTEHPAAVLPLLTDPDPLVRSRAAAYFAAARDDRAVAALSTLLDDPDQDAAGAAAAALGAIGGDAARQTLERAASGPRATVAAAAAQALARLGNPESVAGIIDAASRMSAYDRGRLVEALVAFGAAAREPLLTALGGDRLRPAALQALDGLDAVLPVSALARYRADERPSVRELVARLLGRTGDPAALDALRVLLGDSSPAVREAAVAAVSDLGSPDAAALLRTALSAEQDEWVARAIRRALLQLGSVP